MSTQYRPPLAWIVAAHCLGGLAIGALESARLGGASLALVLIPLFAATGLVAGALLALAERLAGHRRWWIAALAIAAPSLIVTASVARTLFQGAYAQTLPLAAAMPVLVPVALWFAVALAVAAARRVLRAPDLMTRAIAILACAGLLGGIVWIERNVLKTGYPDAHVGATLALIVIAGALLRVVRRANISPYATAALAALALGTSVAAAVDGLGAARDRSVLATYGDQGRDLVRLWRGFVDRDGDGSSPILGGGDCDDRDAARHPGAADHPSDGIDQDCDGADALPPPPPAAPPAPKDLATWRATSQVASVLAHTKDMNVLVITIDALRFDVLAPETVDRTEFPNLVKLLDESVFFTRAFAPAAGTDVSLGTLLTGRIDPFQPVDWTLLEAVQGLGRRTTTTFPAEVNRYVSETMLRRGVDRARTVHTDWETDNVGDHISGGATTLEGLKALDEARDAGGARWLTWLHYFDVHEHHQIKVPAALRAEVSAAGGVKRHTYRALLRAIDKEILRIRSELASRGLADSTIILFASDHGESLGDDPRIGDTHGKVVYAPLVRIPFAFYIPGVAPGVRTDPATLVDLAPTLLGLLGAPRAMAPLDGIDLLPAILDAPIELRAPARALTIHEELQWGVVDWPHQLIVSPADDVVELYDLVADPMQRQNLADQQPDLVRRLRARYAEAPQVRVDRTLDGRKWRERQARPPANRVPRPAGEATPTP